MTKLPSSTLTLFFFIFPPAPYPDFHLSSLISLLLIYPFDQLYKLEEFKFIIFP